MSPELSIIIPVLDEAPTLPGLLIQIARQQAIDAEVIISDGGSTDAGSDIVEASKAWFPLPVIWVEGVAGRGTQLNRGAEQSRGKYLLFLHADSAFCDARAVEKALSLLKGRLPGQPNGRLAARFPLIFNRSSSEPSLPYFWMEQKARLNRRHCIHGDQGYLLSKEYFDKIGGFPEGLPVGEDTIFAETVAGSGQWLLAPTVIGTSARRFEKEGLRERQILNSVLLYLIHRENYPLLSEVPHLYHLHTQAGCLEPGKIIRSLERRLTRGTFGGTLSLWYDVGCYIRENEWQLPFLLDVMHAFRRDRFAKIVDTRWLDLYDRFLCRITDNPLGRTAAGAAGFLFFRLVWWCWKGNPGCDHTN